MRWDPLILKWQSPLVAMLVNEVRSFDSEMAVTVGCHVLSRHFSTLMLSSSSSNFLPRLMSWFIVWENLFCTSHIDSPFCILKSSYSWIRPCFLTLFTSFVPSCVTSKMSHVSLAELYCETLKSSSLLKAYVIMFLAIQSNLAFLDSASVQSNEGLSIKTSSFLT